MLLSATAPKSVPEDNTYPGDREPLWVTAAAARIDNVGVEFQRLRHRDGLSDEAPGANADQDDIDTPAARIRGMPGASAGVGLMQWPSDAASELAALRMAGASPHGFAPWRHAMMVAGRPVVVPLVICEHQLKQVCEGYRDGRIYLE